MEKNIINNSIKQLRESSKKRNFDQTIDLVLNLKQIDVKKEDNKQDHFIALPSGRGKKIKICALVDQELFKEAKANCDKVFLEEEFSRLKKKDLKKAATECTYFIAQANIMPSVAKTFGRTLGARGKMPNPKAGCVVPGNINLKPVIERLQKTVRIITKNEPIIKVSVGTESMKDSDLAENISYVYSYIESVLPQGKNNIKNAILKTTMGKPIPLSEQTKNEAS